MQSLLERYSYSLVYFFFPIFKFASYIAVIFSFGSSLYYIDGNGPGYDARLQSMRYLEFATVTNIFIVILATVAITKTNPCRSTLDWQRATSAISMLIFGLMLIQSFRGL